MRYPPQLSRLAAILIAAFLAVPTTLSGSAAAATDDDDFYEDNDPSARVARVSFVDGDASLRQPNSDEWEEVGRNTPVFVGDEYYTGGRSRLEIQLGGGRYVRLGERTDVVFAELTPDYVRMEVPAGTIVVSLRNLDRGERFEISAPAAAMTIREQGIYRVDVDQSGNTQLAVVRGSADVSDTSESLELRAGESIELGPSSNGYYDVVSYVDRDDLDDWSSERDSYYEGYYASSTPVSSIINRNDIYGLVELAAFGSWHNVNGYGYCWQPSVSSGWAPYSDGYWQWYPGYGYTWVSNEPWGWAPYHSGRWTYDTYYGWIWVPWSSFSGGGYYWYPHQTYFYGYNGYNGYAWVPLAPNEPYVSYRALNRRHRGYSGFQPVHLRNGRGIAVAPRGDNGRLRPVRVDPKIKLRGPVDVVPTQPARIAVVKPRFDPRPADSLRVKPVVVREVRTDRVKPRTGADATTVVARRPIKVATDAPPKEVRVEPRGRAREDSVPTMVDIDKPAPRRQQPSVDTGARQDDSGDRRRDGGTDSTSRGPRNDSDGSVTPRRPRAERDNPSNDGGGSPEAVKPRRQPIETNGDGADRRNRNNDRGTGSEVKPRERARDTDKPDRGNVEVAPRRDQSPDRTRNVERSNPPAPRVERSNPPAPRVERSNPPPQQSSPPPARVDPPRSGHKPNND